ncbi:MAG: two-component system sensor histidine kinase NtrB [Thermoleophilia bacterium]
MTAAGKAGTKAWSQIRDAVLVAVAIVVITYFHYYPPHFEFITQDDFHILLRRLYYVPILYAAFRFGIKGGLLASLSVSALFIPHAIMSMGGLFVSGSLDNLFEVILYNVLALITGAVVEAKRRQAQRYQEVLKLNSEIEERETAIRHMKAYTESVLSSVSSGVIACDRRGIVVTVNPAAKQLLARHEDDLVAFPMARIFKDHPGLVRAAEQILSGGQERATLETELSSDGRLLPVAVRIAPHRSRGQTVGIVITIEDLSEVQDLTEQLLRADKLSGLGELVAGVAHEVRNPLGVIKASVQMLEQEMDSGCGDAELTHVMVQEIDRLDSVVNALLDFGRPSESQFGTVDTARVMGEVVLLTKQFARQQGVEVKNDLPAGLPQIWADEDRLKQIFVNLISNAIQAMPDGGSLTMDGIARDGYLRISFADSGIGMSPEEKERIFDPFHTTRAEGSGLGLSIVHRIIDAHQGFISVDSEPGKGSTFVVGLPLTRTAAETGDGAYA